MRVILFILLFSLTSLALATRSVTYYRCEGDAGEIIMSDRPCGERAETREIRFDPGTPEPPTTETASDTPAATETPTASREESEESDEEGISAPGSFIGYESVAITSPRNGEVVRSEEGEVNISITLTPALREGNQVRILLDGREVARESGTTLTISGVAAGRRSLQATVVNEQNVVFGSSEVVRFVLF